MLLRRSARVGSSPEARRRARSVRRGTKVGRLARLGRAADATFLVWHLVSSVDRCARRSHHAEPLIPSPSSTLRRPSSCRPLAVALRGRGPPSPSRLLRRRVACRRRPRPRPASGKHTACYFRWACLPCAQFVDVALAPWRRRTEDDPFSSLRQDRCATPVRGPIRPAGREAHNMAKQPAIDDLSTGAPPVLVPAGGKSSRLRLAGKVVSRPPAV